MHDQTAWSAAIFDAAQRRDAQSTFEPATPSTSAASAPLAVNTTTILSTIVVDLLDSAAVELINVGAMAADSSMATPSTTAATVDVEPTCLHISEAIKAQGIDDLTSHFAVQSLFSVTYGCLFVLGLIGNGGVVIAMARNKRLRSARNIFLLNLILTDILLCLTAILVTPYYALSKEWVFGGVMCRLMPLSTSCAVFVTSWSLTAIAVDKFVHITDPTREQFSVRLATCVTVLIWLICSLINIPYLMSFELVDGSYYAQAMNGTPFCGQFCDEINWQGEMRQLYGSTVMLFQFVVPLTIITYCYVRILARVHKDMIVQNVQFCQSLTSSQRLNAIERKKRVNFILITMVAAFLLSWLPLTALNLARDFKMEPEFVRVQPYLCSLLANSIAMSTVVVNPLLFFWLTRKQKRAKLSGILNTSDLLASFVSRVHSMRSVGSSFRFGGSMRFGSSHIKRSSPPSPVTEITTNNNTLATRPLIVSAMDEIYARDTMSGSRQHSPVAML